MKPNNIILPGYRIYEYMLILNPHEDLRNRIAKVRAEFNSEFSVTPNTGSKPNLALARFTQYEMMEERISNRLRTIAMGYAPFKVELKNFGSFPSHTIYISVPTKEPIQNLVKQIRTETQRLMKQNDENKPYFILEPHITVGRKLKPWQYEKGWLKYSNSHFSGKFIADAFLLLKRPQGEMGWQIAGRFELKNLPVNITQGELF